jgi:ABC-type amino acid transport substrate-binding protein
VRQFAAAIAFTLALCPLAHAGPIVDRIKSSGVIRCGGVPRPGLVGQSPDGAPSGLYLDLCRAVGAALLGPEGRIEFHPYDSDKAFRRVADGAYDLFFLDGSDIADHRLAGAVTLGPAVYFVSTAAMVHGDATIQQLSDLAGKSICFYQGDNAHLNLEASMAARRLDFVRMGYMEYGELHDAYNSRICEAQVGESGDLAAARLEERAAPASRILTEPLAAFPLYAALRQATRNGRRLSPGRSTPCSGPSSLRRPGPRQASSLWASRGETSAWPTIGPNALSASPDPMPTFMPVISAKARLSSFRAVPTRRLNTAACSSRLIGNSRAISESVLSVSNGLRRHFRVIWL